MSKNGKRVFEPSGGWTDQYGYNHLINRIHNQDAKLQRQENRLNVQSDQLYKMRKLLERLIVMIDPALLEDTQAKAVLRPDQIEDDYSGQLFNDEGEAL